MKLKINTEFKNQFPYLKLSHCTIVKYLLNWILGDNPPEIKEFDGKPYFWVSCKKLSDDLDLSKMIVRRSLYRLENKDKNTNYFDNESILFSKIVYEKEQQTKLYLTFNYRIVHDMFENGDEIVNLISEKTGVNMPALFEMEKKKYSENAEKIVCDIINGNSDLFKTRISRTKTFEKCCVAVQDIYDGRFTNSHLYDISKNISTNQFDYEGWKEKINSVKNDWSKIKELIEKAIKNYRLMFVKQNMPSNKKYLPDSLDKWFYDELNDNGYPSYFVFSLRKPKPQKIQYADNNADKIYEKLPEKLQIIGDEILEENPISNKFVFWENFRSLYRWCNWLFGSDINQNIGYWVSSPYEIITKFVDYCEQNNIIMNEYSFNIHISLNKNTPFAWFVTDAINEHKLNKEILKSCA